MRGLAGLNSAWLRGWLKERRLQSSGRDLLAAAGAVFDSSLDHLQTMRTIAQTAVPAVAELCIIDLLRADGSIGECVAAAVQPGVAERLEQSRRERPLDPSGGHPVARALRFAEAVVIEDLSDPAEIERLAQGGAQSEQIASGGYRSVVVMPLLARGRLLGALSFVHVQHARHYEPDRLALMHDLAGRAAMALDNARLYEERAHIAQTLQSSLLPDALPRIDGLELASAYHPAGEEGEVGGDFYDVFEARCGCWLVVGDVCGKGPEAAAVTALVRHSIRALSFVWDSPAQVLGAVNEVMLGHALAARFATAVLVRIELQREPARAAIAAAGHPAPLLVDAQGSPRVLSLPGTLLGIREQLRAEDAEIELHTGSALVLYTDGLLDAGAPQRLLGTRELELQLEGLAGSPELLVAKLEQLALSYGGGRLRDDVAILAARVTASQQASRKLARPPGYAGPTVEFC
jgi:stage II sporulation SpoE-like protein/GAF domain-containing protein